MNCWRMAFPRVVSDFVPRWIVEAMDRAGQACFVTRLSSARQLLGFDRLCERDRAARHLGMQPLDHAALERDHAFVLVLRQIERRDEGARLRDLLGAWRKGCIR